MDQHIFNILIVDDTPVNLQMLSDLLDDKEFKVREVLNGMQALLVAEKEKPDLILLDIMMPEMDGFEVCRRLKENQDLMDVPIIFISALNDSCDIVKAFNAGAADYITKPFRAEEVKARVTTHLKLYQQKKEIQEQSIVLQKLNAEKDKFFSIIAHDLRGPMSGFMQITELLADKKRDLSAEEVSEMTDNLKHSARNTFNLLENLLEWSQIGKGLSDFNLEQINLNKIVTECINILAAQARGKGIKLVDEISNETEVIADKNMLQSVIRNLFSNAIKFTRKGGKVSISAQTAENNQILVSVKDNGIGMTEDLRNELFHIGANTKRPGTQGEKSTGLGLLLCKEFVEKQGGKISVESKQKIGSVFSFILPLGGSSQKKYVPEIVVPPDSQKRTLKNLNILIADDDEITAKLISYYIKGISNQVFRAKTGKEAVEICRNNPGIDLIFMDIKMPDMDGYEATRQIRKFNPKLVILAQSTFAMKSDLGKALKAGVTDYVTKPFKSEIILAMIQKYMNLPL
jgi:CheY-like chemotaxis protein